MDPCEPIPQLLEPVHRTHEIAIPARRYFRPISPALLSYYSLAYSEYRHASEAQLSSWCFDCQTYHTPQRLCLPNFSVAAMELLLDFLEQTPSPTASLGLLLDVLHLCGYLAISPGVVSNIVVFYCDFLDISTLLTVCHALCDNGYPGLAQTFSAWLFA